MRDIFSTTFREAIDLSVPKHTVKIRSEDQLPPGSTRRLKSSTTHNPYFAQRHKEQGVTTKRPSDKSSVNISRIRSANHFERVIVSLSTEPMTEAKIPAPTNDYQTQKWQYIKQTFVRKVKKYSAIIHALYMFHITAYPHSLIL